MTKETCKRYYGVAKERNNQGQMDYWKARYVMKNDGVDDLEEEPIVEEKPSKKGKK